MMSDWEWRQDGLYDGEVPIVWAAQSIQGELFCGVMADWEDLIASVPSLARNGTLLHPFVVEATRCNRHLVRYALHIRNRPLLCKTIGLAWRVFWLALWEYVRKLWR